MRIEFLIIADAIQVADGKFFMLGGGWNAWRSGVFPAQAVLGIGVSIIVDWNEAGTGTAYPINVTIADEAGIPIFPPVQAQFQVNKPPEAPQGTAQRIPFAFNVGVQIPRAGRYFVNALVGSKSRAQVFFDAIFVGTKVEIPSLSVSPTERGN